MPYINAETVGKMRKAIKEAMPGWKFSIRCRDHMAVDITILRGNVEFDLNGREYASINVFHFKTQHSPKAVKALEKIIAAIDSVEPRKTLYEDGDYGSIPNYYLNIRVGDYDRPYVKV